MDFEHYSAARDFFYLSVLLLGSGFGSILHYFRRKSTGRFRNKSITAGFLLFSGAAVALTVAVIFSKGLILKEFPLYLPACILASVLMLAFRFPRAFGFPAVLASGVFIVWLGYAYLRFPVIDDPDRFRQESHSFCISFPPYVPLIGGVARGYRIEIPADNSKVAP